jgi:hypothetical protein
MSTLIFNVELSCTDGELVVASCRIYEDDETLDAALLWTIQLVALNR